MTIEDIGKVDSITINRETGDVRLLISDHLDWDENEGEHLLVLQHKLNNYLEFVESGQMYAKYPVTQGRKIILLVMGKFALSEEAKKFYGLAAKTIEEYGCSLQFIHYKPGTPLQLDSLES